MYYTRGESVNAKPFFVLVFFLTLIVIFAGGMMKDYDLTGGGSLGANTSPSGPNSVVAGASTSWCGSSYTVQSGDTLSRIAQSCGVTLQDILLRNPSIGNPNLIRPGQKIALPVQPVPSVPTLTVTGLPTLTPTSTPTATPRPGIQPGDTVSVEIMGFPPNTDVEVGIGKVNFFPTPIKQDKTDEKGGYHISVEIPKKAQANEQWTVFITNLRQPEMRITAVPFIIGK